MLVCEDSLCPRKLPDVSGPGLGEAGRYRQEARRPGGSADPPAREDLGGGSRARRPGRGRGSLGQEGSRAWSGRGA